MIVFLLYNIYIVLSCTLKNYLNFKATIFRYLFIPISVIIFLLASPRLGICFDPLFFDFGTKDSPVMNGFTRITPDNIYDGKHGFGWIPPYPKSKDAGQHATRKNRGLKNDPDSMTCDFIDSGSSSFQIDLPPGRYWITAWMGTIGGGMYQPNKNFGIKAQEKTILEVPIDSTNFYTDFYFKNQDWEINSNTDIFEEIIAPRLPEHTVAIDTNGKSIRLQVFGLPWLALAVLPNFPGDNHSTIIEKIRQKRKKEFYDRVFRLEWPQKSGVPPAPSDKELQLGYILFKRDVMEPIWPNSTPSTQERNLDGLAITASGGETGVLSLGFLPLFDLDYATLKLDGEISNALNVIKRDQVKISRVSYGISGSRNKDLNNCRLVPWIVKPSTGCRLSAHWTIRYLITIDVPKGTSAGKYTGTLIFEAKNRPSTKIKICVNVLPFDLLEGNDYCRGFFYYTPRWYTEKYFKGQEAGYWKAVERDLRLMKKYGFNAIDVRGLVKEKPIDGSIELDFTQLNAFWKLYKRIGLSGYAICSDGLVGTGRLRDQSPFSLPGKLPYTSKQQIEPLMNTIRSFRDEALQSKWPGTPAPLVLWCTDELGSHAKDNVEIGIDLLKIYKSVHGIRKFSTINSKEEMALLPYLDIVAMNTRIDINQKVIDKVKNSRTDLAFYNLGGSRYAFGYFIWKSKSTLYLQWNWNNPKQDPFIAIDGFCKEDSYAYHSLNHIYPTYQLEQARLGVTDYRYVRTLEEYIRHGEQIIGLTARQKRALSNGHETLNNLNKNCSLEISKIHHQGIGRWEKQHYLKARSDISNTISELRNSGITLNLK